MPFHFNYEQKYPYSDFEKINLDWILELATQLKEAAENGDFDGPPGPPGSGTATNGVAYITTSDTFADIQAAITDGQLPVLMYYNMGTPCFLYCYDHASSVLKFGGLSGTQQLQLTWYSNDTKAFSTRTLVDKQAPEFYGFPTIVNTLPAGDSSHKIATTSFVQNAVTTAVQAAIEQLVIAPFSESFKQALLQLARKVAYIDGNGQTYYQTLYDALYPPINVESISAVWNPPVGYVVYSTDTIDSLKSYLTVTATYDDQSTAVLDSTDYVLSGTLTPGTSTITVTYAGETTTFNVTVVDNIVTSVSAIFTQESNIVYWWDDLDYLKQWLVVTATYSNSSTIVVPAEDYELSGTLSASSSTVTVTYGGETDTFTVTVNDGTQYSYEAGTLTKEAAAVGDYHSSGTVYQGKMTFDTESGNKRRAFVLLRGEHKMFDYTTKQYVDYYPVPVPPTATSVTVGLTPTSQYFGMGLWKYENDAFTRIADPGWKQNSYTHTFTAANNLFVSLTTKYNSSGTSYPTEPTNITLAFS